MRKIAFLIFMFPMLNCSKKLYTHSDFFDYNRTSDFKADTDTKQLIYAILERAVVSKKDIPSYKLIKDKMNIYINNVSYSKFHYWLDKPQENLIDPKDVPTQIEKVRFCIKSKLEIQAISDKTDDFLYLIIGNIVINNETAKIGLSNNWVVSKKNKGKYAIMSGGGYILTFKKINGNWIFDKNALINSWQS
ncbi:hypothetical protein [Jejuia spongiicola]|uniref:Uncharacterized protein n=1 Tax=Jejuia spongiicola TaxID=2942207 RepID=A0ABT0QJB5_9FLAO|nr:hypothetical protein [Jejuia spongiicola]MCL6296359.1 hypothetical protein [Jejuia spongiicola]